MKLYIVSSDTREYPTDINEIMLNEDNSVYIGGYIE